MNACPSLIFSIHSAHCYIAILLYCYIAILLYCYISSSFLWIGPYFRLAADDRNTDNLAQLLCRILQQWVMPTVGPSPKSKVGITHFQLLCQFIVGRVPEMWGRCQVEQVSSGYFKSINPPLLWGRSHSRHYPQRQNLAQQLGLRSREGHREG